MDLEKRLGAETGDGKSSLGTGSPETGSGHRPEMVPVLNSPPLPAQLPIPRGTLDKPQPQDSSFDRARTPSQSRKADGAPYDELTLGQSRD